MPPVTRIQDESAAPAVRGFLHLPDGSPRAAMVLAHGAGADANAPLLIGLAEAFAKAGVAVLRCDLPFRQARPHGPPFPAMAAQDRAGLERAAGWMRAHTGGRLFLGGHSYGGRQSTMLAADQPQAADGLLLLSYPLHPPRRPAELRTGHFTSLTTPALFVHGTRDPFGSLAEMEAALKLIPGPHELLAIEGAGHDLRGKSQAARIAGAALEALERFTVRE